MKPIQFAGPAVAKYRPKTKPEGPPESPPMPPPTTEGDGEGDREDDCTTFCCNCNDIVQATIVGGQILAEGPTIIQVSCRRCGAIFWEDDSNG